MSGRDGIGYTDVPLLVGNRSTILVCTCWQSNSSALNKVTTKTNAGNILETLFGTDAKECCCLNRLFDQIEAQGGVHKASTNDRSTAVSRCCRGVAPSKQPMFDVHSTFRELIQTITGCQV
jgi:hypothetical protein